MGSACHIYNENVVLSECYNIKENDDVLDNKLNTVASLISIVRHMFETNEASLYREQLISQLDVTMDILSDAQKIIASEGGAYNV